MVNFCVYSYFFDKKVHKVRKQILKRKQEKILKKNKTYNTTEHKICDECKCYCYYSIFMKHNLQWKKE